MEMYHKINSIYKRDPATKHKDFIVGDYSCPEFEYLKDNKWVFTEKVDGTNIRVSWDGQQIRLGGRTDNAQIPVPLYEKLNSLFLFNSAKKFLEVFDYDVGTDIDVCLYGEGYGKKIQKGGGNYNPDGVDFVLFDVRIGHVWLERSNVDDIAQKFLISCVPVIDTGTLDVMVDIAKQGIWSQWGDFQAEGIVARPAIEMRNRMGNRIITKVKCKDFIGS